MNFKTKTETQIKIAEDRVRESWKDQAGRRWEVERIEIQGGDCVTVSVNGSGYVMSREEAETLKNAIGFVLTTV